MEGGYLTTLNKSVTAVMKLGVGQMTDEAKGFGS